MNEYEEFLNGIAAVIGVAGALGMFAAMLHSAYQQRCRLTAALQGIDAATGGTAAPLQAPAPPTCPSMRVGAPPEVYKSHSLLITGCSDRMMWYASKIGQEVPYLGTWPSEGSHKSREDAGYVNIVKISDARIIVREGNTQ